MSGIEIHGHMPLLICGEENRPCPGLMYQDAFRHRQESLVKCLTDFVKNQQMSLTVLQPFAGKILRLPGRPKGSRDSKPRLKKHGMQVIKAPEETGYLNKQEVHSSEICSANSQKRDNNVHNQPDRNHQIQIPQLHHGHGDLQKNCASPLDPFHQDWPYW